MKVVGLVEGLEHVCCRYRLAAFHPYFQKAGHSLDLRALPRSWWRRLLLFRDLSQFDVVILQRKLLQAWQLAVLRRHARRLVFDFDDAVFLRDSYAGRPLTSTRRSDRFNRLMATVDAVVAGNAFLAGQARARGLQRPLSVIPTCVDPLHYPLAKHEKTYGRARLVWIGSASTLPGLERIRDWLEETGKRIPGLSLKLIADQTAYFTPLLTQYCRWYQTTEAAELAEADVGISWLPEDDWSRGKCGLKVLQYMAAGLPVVANSVGVQAEMIQHGVTGFLVATRASWLEVMKQLISNPAMRAKLGQAGRQYLESRYSVPTGAAKWLNLLDQLQGGKKAA